MPEKTTIQEPNELIVNLCFLSIAQLISELDSMVEFSFKLIECDNFFLSLLVFVLSRPCSQDDCGVSCLTKDFILNVG